MYAVAKGIANEPAFSWWVPYTVKRKFFIIDAIKYRLKVATHKYGVEIRTCIEHAICLDAINGNRLQKRIPRQKYAQCIPCLLDTPDWRAHACWME